MITTRLASLEIQTEEKRFHYRTWKECEKREILAKITMEQDQKLTSIPKYIENML